MKVKFGKIYLKQEIYGGALEIYYLEMLTAFSHLSIAWETPSVGKGKMLLVRK